MSRLPSPNLLSAVMLALVCSCSGELVQGGADRQTAINRKHCKGKHCKRPLGHRPGADAGHEPGDAGVAPSGDASNPDATVAGDAGLAPTADRLQRIFNQNCTPTQSGATFMQCAQNSCCELVSACSADPDCQTALACMQAGSFRGYDTIMQCKQNPGIYLAMQVHGCRFAFCAELSSGMSEGEKCLSRNCVQESAACFSNPECYSIKFCYVDGEDTRQGCIARFPAGAKDFETWTKCGLDPAKGDGDGKSCFQKIP
jgi:hypothetical protein